MDDITVLSRTLSEEQGHKFELVELSTGASFRSWLSKCFGDQALEKGQQVRVVDGSMAKKGKVLVSGEIISIRDNSIWVYNAQKNKTLICYPHSDKVTPIAF